MKNAEWERKAGNFKMSLIGFSGFVRSLAEKEGVQVEITEENTEYIARFSNGVVLIGFSSSMRIRILCPESAKSGFSD